MAWVTPLSAVANASLTAAQWNASVRDNLLETAPAKATASGNFFASTGVNTIAERVPTNTTVSAAETSTSTTYTNLATAGPAVTVTTGPRALVILSTQLTTNTSTLGAFMSYAVSGATTVAATDGSAIVYYPASVSLPVQTSRAILQGVNAGSNTFTAQYHVAGACTGTWTFRNLTVMPF